MRTLYHVTTKQNWERIKLKGLKPRIGYLAGPVSDFIWMAETKPAVYLFTEIGDEDFWYFVDHWMAWAYGGVENLVLLEVKFPKRIRKLDKHIEKEWRRMKSLMKRHNTKFYFPVEAFYNYEIRDEKEFVCYKKIPAKYIRQIPFPEVTEQ